MTGPIFIFPKKSKKIFSFSKKGKKIFSFCTCWGYFPMCCRSDVSVTKRSVPVCFFGQEGCNGLKKLAKNFNSCKKRANFCFQRYALGCMGCDLRLASLAANHQVQGIPAVSLCLRQHDYAQSQEACAPGFQFQQP